MRPEEVRERYRRAIDRADALLDPRRELDRPAIEEAEAEIEEAGAAFLRLPRGVVPTRQVAPFVPRARREACQRGHTFTLENTLRFRSGQRACRTCLRAAQARHRERAREGTARRRAALVARDLARVRDLYRAGRTVDEVALELGVSPSTILNDLHSSGEAVRPAHRVAGKPIGPYVARTG